MEKFFCNGKNDFCEEHYSCSKGCEFFNSEGGEYRTIKPSSSEQMRMLMESELETYKIKNAKYGDSFSHSIEKYGLISALTRMSDKWNRIENLIINHDEGTNDESLIDSLMDLANYCNMTVMAIENGKTE